MKRTKFTFELEKGDVVSINGFPFTYIGDGLVEGATDPTIVLGDQIKAGVIETQKIAFSDKDCKCIQPCDCSTIEEKEARKPGMQKALSDLIKSLEEEEAREVENPGFILDPYRPVVFGPGLHRVGDGCCSTKF